MAIEAQEVLNRVRANVFLVDEDWNITYINSSATESLRAIKAELKDALGLECAELVGQRLSDLDQDPARRLAMLNSTSELSFECNLQFGGVSINAKIEDCSPLLGSSCRLVTWEDESELHRMRQSFADFSGQVEAISRSQAVIEFETDGTIISANDVFLELMGYRLDEIVGKHHHIFVDAASRSSADYERFWSRLGSGTFETGEYKRIAKDGSEVWLQSSYNAILDQVGNPVKVVKYASDVTEQKELFADFAGQIGAIDKSLAVIHFEMDGTIMRANQLFLDVMGYSTAEIVGRPHSIFVDEETKNSKYYKESWDRLRKGEFLSGQFKRIAKSGQEVWLQSSYNPILDLNGKPVKVVKYAFEVSDQVEVGRQMAHVLEAVGANAKTLSAASAELTLTSEQMGENSSSTSEQANTLASAADQVSENVSSVADGIEALTVSIGEIAQNASSGASVAQRAVEVAMETNDSISKLSQSSAEIGNVVKVIKSIASQTNLLALNASIEAARAGDAGKGFAVVADEVKTLATSTKKATADIKEKVEAIQNDTKVAIEEIDNISRIIKNIDEIQRSIAGAVDKQNVTTVEMSRGIVEAATGSSEIADSITNVAMIAKAASEGANETHGAAEDLGRMAAELEALTGPVH